LRNIGGAAVRSSDANMFMALLAIYKVGVLVNNLADSSPDDGTLDPAFHACSMSAANQALAGSALWELNSSLSQLTGSTFFSAISTGMTALCTALSGLATNENFCAATDPKALSANQLKGVMTSIKEGSAFGVDECGGGQSVVTCNCP
jgi:hypothetical protein